MKNIVLYGAGGLAKEIAQLIEDINSITPQWNILGYIDDVKGDCGEVINGYKILGTYSIMKDMDRGTNVILAVGDPAVKRKIYGNVLKYDPVFPVLIHPTAIVASTAALGEGAVVCAQTIVSVNAKIGRHVLLNAKSFIAHDVVIHDYCSCFINSIVNGSVTIGESAVIGSNSVILEKKAIGDRAKVGMGAVVMFDVEKDSIVMSRPSKSMFFGKESEK